MALTLGNIIIILVALSIITLIGFTWQFETKPIAIVDLIVCIVMILGFSWYNTSTASGIRSYKDWNSELSNGIEREITITAEDGREIFHYEGKVDIESNHEDNYIKFESEEGKRYIIYYGIQDTIKIIEK